MLLRKKGAASTIIAVALLIALIASINSIVNNLNQQATALTSLSNVGETFLIVNKNSNSLSDSQVDPKISDAISNIPNLAYVLPQKLLTAQLTTKSGSSSIAVRGVENVSTFLNARNANINGSPADNETQANIGEILANLANINKKDEVSLTLNQETLRLTVTGIIQTRTQSDTELVVPMETANELSESDATVSFIEFGLQGNANSNDIINQITSQLPTNTKIIQVQQLQTFSQDIANQTLTFLNIWSIVVYAVVVAASYVVASRLITEANYEISMLRNLGAKRSFTLKLVLTYTLAITLLGTILGIAIGLVGGQAALTAIRWVWSSVGLTSYLEITQVLQILASALIASAIGCIYPAIKTTYDNSGESQT